MVNVFLFNVSVRELDPEPQGTDPATPTILDAPTPFDMSSIPRGVPVIIDLAH